jgi:uncharacterized membrane protein YdfJ with MMPL/SSD domain
VTALGHLVTRHARLVVVAWLLLAAVAVPGATRLSGALVNGGFTVKGSQSARADALAREHVTHGDRNRVLIAVGGAAAGLDAAAARAGRAVAGDRHVAAVGAPRRAAGGTSAIVPVDLAADLSRAQEVIPDLRARARAAAGPGRDATIVGAAPVFERYSVVARGDLATVEHISFPVTTVIILVAFLSFVAAGVPVVLAGLGLVVSFGALFALAHLTELSVFATNTALVLGLGLSIDYALFSVTRLREALRAHDGDVAAAVRETVRTTGRAILFSGMTIVVAIGSLLATGIGVFQGMALGAMTATLVSVAGAVTLVPSVLMLLGHRIDRLQIGWAARAAHRERLWRRLAVEVIRHRVLVVALLLPALLLAAVPLRHAQIGFPTSTALPRTDPERRAGEQVARAFGPGVAQPVLVVGRDGADALRRALAREPGLRPDPEIQRGDGGWVQALAEPRDPPDGAAARATIRRLRADLTTGPRPAALAVGGATASGMDLVDRLNARTPLVIALAALATMLLLLIAFRSVVVPLKAACTVVLSVGATLGILTFLYRTAGLGDTDQLSYFVPLFLFAIVFGLSTDYEVFLLSRIREEHLSGRSNDVAIEQGVVKSARSITLAGLVMIVVFLAQATSAMDPLRQLGLGMALAIFIDTTVVRSLLVPATMSLLGERNWWMPGRARVRSSRVLR